MLVDNSSEWQVHKSTGKELNKFNQRKQISLDTIKPILAILELQPKAKEYISAYKKAYPKTHDTTLEALLPLYMKLLQLNFDEVLCIDSNIVGSAGALLKKQGLKKVIDKMESIGHIEIFSGFTYKEEKTKYNKAIPTAIRLLERKFKG